MKMQTKVLAAVAILIALDGAPELQAQGRPGMGGTPEKRAEQRVTQLTTPLELTAQQVEQIRPIITKQITEQAALMQKRQAGGDQQAIRAEMQTLRQKTDEQILALLTDAQKPLYQKLQEKEAARRRNGTAGGARR